MCVRCQLQAGPVPHQGLSFEPNRLNFLPSWVLPCTGEESQQTKLIRKLSCMSKGNSGEGSRVGSGRAGEGAAVFSQVVRVGVIDEVIFRPIWMNPKKGL